MSDQPIMSQDELGWVTWTGRWKLDIFRGSYGYKFCWQTTGHILEMLLHAMDRTGCCLLKMELLCMRMNTQSILETFETFGATVNYLFERVLQLCCDSALWESFRACLPNPNIAIIFPVVVAGRYNQKDMPIMFVYTSHIVALLCDQGPVIGYALAGYCPYHPFRLTGS